MARNVTADRDMGWKRIRQVANDMPGSYIDVGYWGPKMHRDSSDTIVEIATTHEFGKGRVPERSFLRHTADKHAAKYRRMLGEAQAAIADGKTSVKAGLAGVGARIASDVIARFSDPIPPKLEDSTIARRRYGGDTPLVDTGTLRASVQVRVVIKNQTVQDGLAAAGGA